MAKKTQKSVKAQKSVKTPKLVLNVGALLGSCKVVPVTTPSPVKTFVLASRINALQGLYVGKELFPRAAQAAVVRQLGFATAGTGPAGAELIVLASETDVSVSAGSKGVVKLKARIRGLEIGNVIKAESISIQVAIRFDAAMNNATIGVSGAFKGLKIAGQEFSVKVSSAVAKPLWNPSHLTLLDAQQVVFAQPLSHLARRSARLGDADREPWAGIPLKASRHSLATVSAGGDGATRVSGNVVNVKHGQDVGRVIIGDLLVMRSPDTPLWLELAAIRAEFTQLVNPEPYGGGGTHDDGSHGGG